MAFLRKKEQTLAGGLEGLLRLLVDSSPEGMVICDSNNRVVFANTQFCLMFGWSQHEVTGRDIDELVAGSPDICEEASLISSTMITTPHMIPETVRSRKDGSSITVSILAGPVYDGGDPVGAYGIYRDISGKKITENEVRRKKAFFENLFDNAPGAIVLCDRNERAIKANRAFTELFGYSLEEIEGRDLNQFIASDPELLREAIEIDERVWSAKGPVTVDTWRTRKDGVRIPVKILQFPFRIDEQTEVDYTIYLDRSQELKAEAALRREKAFFENLFEACPDAIILSSREGRVIRANRSFFELFGYSEDDPVIGEDIFGIITKDPDSEEEARRLEEIFWNGGEVNREVVRQRKDGTNIQLDLTQVPFRLEDGSVVDYIIYRDITSRKEAEQALRESEKRYSAIVESQVEMVCRYTPDGMISFVNDAFCLFFGFSLEKIISKNLSHIFGEKDSASFAPGGEQLPQDNPAFFFEHSFTLPSGKIRWLRWSKRGIFDENGELTEIQAVGRDVTEIKKTEEELRHLNSILRSIRGVNRLISRHTDSGELVQEICAHLVETRGYRNVWIAILGKGGSIASISEAGIGPDGKPLSERLKHGMLNEWGRSILEKPGVYLKRGVITITDCPLLDRYEEAGIMATRLESAGKIYGLISVSIPGEAPIDPEEQLLFSDLAEDISFALHAMETEKDVQEQAMILEEKARQLELLVTEHPSGLWEWDLEEGRITMNSTYETMLGYVPGELSPSFEAWKSRVHPEDLPKVMKVLENILRGRDAENIYETVFRMKRKDQKWELIRDRGFVVRRDKNGHALRMVGIHSHAAGNLPVREVSE